MIVSVLLAITTLLFSQTPATSQPTVANVFIDLGDEHCASDVAFAAYAQTDTDDEFGALAQPAYVTYTAFQFDDAARSEAALEDVPTLVADAFSDEPGFSESEDFDELVIPVETEDYGDASAAYTMTLPVDNEALGNVLTVELLGIVKNDQLLVILMFSSTGTAGPGPGILLDAIPPFTEDLDERWDGTGDLEDVVPEEDEMPLGWERRDITIDELPEC